LGGWLVKRVGVEKGVRLAGGGGGGRVGGGVVAEIAE